MADKIAEALSIVNDAAERIVRESYLVPGHERAEQRSMRKRGQSLGNAQTALANELARLRALNAELAAALEGVLGRVRWCDLSEGWVPNELPGEKRISRKTMNHARAALAKAKEGKSDG